MTDQEALYRAVCEAPDDDVPRLVYADWLDEHGEHDRATFIRVQCELEQLPPASPEAVRLLAAHHELLQRTDWEDPAGLPGECEWAAHEGDFRRGFRWRVRFPGVESFLSAADELFRAAPIGMVTLPGDTDHLIELARSSVLGRLAGLHLMPTVLSPRLLDLGGRRPSARLPSIETAFATLGKSPFAGRLTEFEVIEGSRRPLDGLQDTPLMGRLERLRIRGERFPPAYLAGADGLTQLDVDGQGYWDGALNVPGDVAARLRRLAVRRFGNPAEAVHGLTAVGPLPALEWLDLSESILTKADMTAFWHSGTVPNVRALGLRGCRLNGAAAGRLLAAPFARQLTLLDLSGNPLGESGADLLGRADLPALEYLGVSLTGLGPESVSRLRDRFGDRLVSEPRAAE